MRLKTDFKGSPPRVFKRGKSYYIRQRLYGRDVWRSLRTGSRREAEELAYKRWFNEQTLEAKDCLDLPDYTYDELWQAYASGERYALLKESTRHTIEQRWDAFAAHAQKRGVKANGLSAAFLLEYLNARGQNKNKTFNNVRNDLMQVLKAGELYLGLPNALRDVPQRLTSRGSKRSDQFRAFNDEEISRIIESLASGGGGMLYAPEWLAACKIALYTGLRYKDVAMLNWSHLDLSKGVLQLVPAKTETKTGKAIILRICPALRELLDALPRSKSLYVLPGLGENYSGTHPTQNFSRLLRRLGINDSDEGIAGFHSLRSTFTTRAKMAGVDTKLLGGILGHSTEAQTRHYNKAALEVDLSALRYKFA